MGVQNKFLVAVTIFAIPLAVVVAWLLLSRRPPPLQDITFQLPWTHSASYAGFYSADKNGDYQKEGLRVEFLVGGPKIDPVQLILDGKAQIGLANGAELVRARGAGKPIKAVSCIYRQSPLVYITLKSSGITHPSEFANKTVRASIQNIIVLKSMISKHQVEFDTIKVVNSNDINQLINGEIDIWSGYSSVSLEQLKEKGIETNVMHPDNYGAHFYYSCIFTTDDMIKQKPNIVLGFLRASLRHGWPRAFRNPDEAAALVKSYGPEVNIENQAKAISIMLPLVDTGTGEIGSMEPEVWKAMADDLMQQGLLEHPVKTEDIFDSHFIDQVYSNDETAS